MFLRGLNAKVRGATGRTAAGARHRAVAQTLGSTCWPLAVWLWLVSSRPALAQQDKETPGPLDFDLGVVVQMLVDAADRARAMIDLMPGTTDATDAFLVNLAQYGFEPGRAFSVAAMCLVLGIAVEVLVRRLLGWLTEDTGALAGTSLVERSAARLLVEAVAIASFAIVACVPLVLLLAGDPVAITALSTLGPALLCVRAFEAGLRTLIRPFHDTVQNRWADLDTAHARKLYLTIVVLASFAALFYFTARLFEQGGMQRDLLTAYILLTRSLVALGLIMAFFINRQGVAHILRTRRSGIDRGARWRAFAAIWHYLAALYVGFSWLWTSVLILVGLPEANTAAALSFMVLFAGVVLGIWLDNWIYQDPDRSDAPLSVFREVMARVGVQAIAATCGVLLVFVWLPTWNDMPFPGEDAALSSAILQIMVAVFLAYFLWQLFSVSTRRLALANADTDLGSSRMLTMIPLVRATILVGLVCVTAVIVMAALGVDLLPLLAGASIFGLAIGLGSQALVKDVVSGLFFFFDDAFRVGELVDVGLAMGTVEHVSLRSMRIRHFFGTVHTIPYGEIQTVANLSRDWVVFPIEFRVPFDVEPGKLQDIIDALGQELAQHPEYGPLFMDPLTFQGVIAMEDETLMVRCFYKTKPGDQWTLRPIVYKELRDLFCREGISVTAREVRVSSHVPPGIASVAQTLEDDAKT